MAASRSPADDDAAKNIIFLKDSASSAGQYQVMKTRLFDLINRTFRSAPAVHPVENGMARRWIKQRLTAVFPELRNNPAALERAYQTLNLEPRPGQSTDEAETVFELHLPDPARVP